MIDITDETPEGENTQETRLLNTAKPEVLSAEEIEAAAEEKRQKDRRQHAPKHDAKGLINEPQYHGIDRRSGRDRRSSYEIRQQELIRRDRRNFFFRSFSYTVGFATLFLGVTFLLFAPECIKIKEFLKTVNFEKVAQSIIPEEGFYLEGFLNRKIETVENYIWGYSESARGIERVNMQNGSKDLATISEVFKRLKNLDRTSGNRGDVSNSLNNLKDAVFNALASNPEDLAKTISSATSYDTILRSILEPIKDKNVTAAAMLIVLNEFRDNVYSGNSYESDLRVIKRLAGDDPELSESLNKLAPYAESGIISKDTLTKEFKSLAQEIVLAKIKGEDAQIKERAMLRFNELAAEAKNKKLAAGDEASIVANAQAMLEQGDVKGAVASLQQLEGPSAQSASSWIENASGSMAAADSSEYIIKELVGNIAGGSGFRPDQLMKMLFQNQGPVYISPALRK